MFPMFDQAYRQNNEHLECKIHTNRTATQFSFMVYFLNIVDVDIFLRIYSQTSQYFTFDWIYKPYILVQM
jgi:hypothetical protein